MPKLVFKGSEEEVQKKRIVYGEVYPPDRIDSDKEYMTAEEIEKMAHDFLRQKMNDQIDVMHENKTYEGVCVVESFIARDGDPDFIPGSWVVGVHIPDDELWGMVEKGELNGFSMEALVKTMEKEVTVDVPPVVSGLTSKSEDHQHRFYVTYDQDGNFKGGTTDVVKGHSHRIRGGTVTDVVNDHSHRFSSVDNIKVVEEA